MIERECFNKLKKLIFDGPKCLIPLIEGIDNRFFSTFYCRLIRKAKKRAFDRQVKLPNFIDSPVNAKVKYL